MTREELEQRAVALWRKLETTEHQSEELQAIFLHLIEVHNAATQLVGVQQAVVIKGIIEVKDQAGANKAARAPAAERARIVAMLRAEAKERDAQAEDVIARNPSAFSAMSGPSEELRKAERAAVAYHQFADAANELRRIADLLESEGAK